MRKPSILRYGVIAVCSTLMVPAVLAQNSIRVFGPVNVRASATGTGFWIERSGFQQRHTESHLRRFPDYRGAFLIRG